MLGRNAIFSNLGSTGEWKGWLSSRKMIKAEENLALNLLMMTSVIKSHRLGAFFYPIANLRVRDKEPVT